LNEKYQQNYLSHASLRFFFPFVSFDNFFFFLLGQQRCIRSAYVNGNAADQLSPADGPQDGQDHRFDSRYRGGQRLRTPGRELKQTDIFAQL
jgi:hypothetical protein